MQNGVRNHGTLSPLLVDKQDEMMQKRILAQLPKPKLYKAISLKKFKTNGVKMVERHNQMKRQLHDYLKSNGQVLPDNLLHQQYQMQLLELQA